MVTFVLFYSLPNLEISRKDYGKAKKYFLAHILKDFIFFIIHGDWKDGARL